MFLKLQFMRIQMYTKQSRGQRSTAAVKLDRLKDKFDHVTRSPERDDRDR